MRDLVLQLQDQVQTQQEQINVQQDVLQDAGLENERGSASMMSSLLESTDFSGHVAASYFYNTNEPEGGTDGGGAGLNAGLTTGGQLSNPFHADHNSFQVDEVWIGMERSGAVGFQFEVVYGATATAVAGGAGNSNDVWIPSANLSYETPWGPTVRAGKFATTIGAESANSTANVNITRGMTYNLQPISHTGVTASGDMGGIAYTIGFVNGAGTEQPDGNSEKGFLWGLSMGNDTSSVSFNGIYEDDGAGGADSGYTLDLVATHNASDNLTMWANLDYISADAGATDPWLIGLSIGSRLGINDDLGIGGRFELVHTDNDVSGAGSMESDFYSITVTSDYALADNLTWKCEVKYEAADGDGGDPFVDGDSGGTSDEAWFLGTQLTYAF